MGCFLVNVAGYNGVIHGVITWCYGSGCVRTSDVANRPMSQKPAKFVPFVQKIEYFQNLENYIKLFKNFEKLKFF